MTTTVSTLKIDKGKPNTAYVGRPSPFGNPYVLGRDGNREEVVEKYRVYFLEKVETDLEFQRQVLTLKDKVLLCFCWPQLCHGSVIAEWLDRGEF